MSTSPRPGRLGRYVALVAAGGVLAVVAVAVLLPTSGVDAGRLAVLAATAAAASALPLRFHRSAGIHGFTLEDGVFIAMLFVLPAGVIPATVVAAGLLGHLVISRDATKVLFNAGQLGLWASAATLTFHALATPGGILRPQALVAVLLARVVVDLVSGLVMANLWRILEDAPLREAFQEWRLNLVTAAGNTAFGLVLANLVADDARLGLLGAALMLGLYLGFRGHAKALDERRRTGALHGVTRSLLDAATSPAPFTTSLARIGELFRASGVELVAGPPGDLVRHLVVEGQASVTSPVDVSSVAREVLATGRPAAVVRVEEPIIGMDGEVGGVAITAPLVRAGTTIGVLTVFGRRGLEPWGETDVTLLAAMATEAAVALDNIRLLVAVEEERARYEAESTKLGEVLTAASDGVALLGRNGTVRVWNPAMARLTGIAVDDALDRRWWEVLRLRDVEDSDLGASGSHVVNAALAGSRIDQSIPLQVEHRQRGWRWIDCTLAPVVRERGASDGTVLVVRDVTGQRELELLKEDFLGTVSHELRTPLTPLKGFVRLLRDRHEDVDHDQRDRMLEAMENQVERLEQLVDDLLLAGGVEPTSVTPGVEVCRLDAVIEHVVRAQEEADRPRVEVLVPPVFARVTRDALDRIVRALVSNALRYTTDPVGVEAEAIGDSVLIRVRDSGAPIPPEEHERIFDRFYRVGHHLTRATGGAGLGLSIARALARRHGGDLCLSTDDDRGNTFIVTLLAPDPREVALAGQDTPEHHASSS